MTIPGFPNYEIEEDGTVWSMVSRHGPRPSPRPVRPWSSKSGKPYLLVTLSRNGEPHHRLVHRLVLETFVGPCPPGMQGCHRPDDDITNNHVSNLVWDTPRSNSADRVAADHQVRGESQHLAKLTEGDVRLIRASPLPNVRLGEMLGVHRHTVRDVRTRRTWRHVS